MAPSHARGLPRLEPSGPRAPEHRARAAAQDAATAADRLRRLQSSVGNAALARLLAPPRDSAPARTQRRFSTASAFEVRIPWADAMPGAEHGLETAPLEAEPPARSAVPEEGEAAPGAPVRLPDIRITGGPQSGTTDGITAFVGYSGVVRNERGGLPPAEDEFGVTWWADVDVKDITLVRVPWVGGFVVKATVHHKVTWEVRDAAGPDGQVDVTSPDHPALTASNYEQVADDLTPRTEDLNGRPPRKQWWSRSLTQKHERFHAEEARAKGEESIPFVVDYLEGKTADSHRAVHDLLFEAGRLVVRYVREMTEFPANEERAYGDGTGAYRALAAAIRERGKAGRYPDAPS